MVKLSLPYPPSINHYWRNFRGRMVIGQEGRAFLHSAALGEQVASRSEVRHVLQRFFGNSRERLLLSLLGDDEITPDELRRLKEAIALLPDDEAKNDAAEVAR